MAGRSVHSGQIVVAEIVAVAVVVAVLSPVPGGGLPVPVAAGAAVVAFGRWRGRWLYQWLGVALRHVARPRALPAGASTADLLGLVAPGAEVRPDGRIEDEYGIIAIVELGDPTSLLSAA